MGERKMMVYLSGFLLCFYLPKTQSVLFVDQNEVQLTFEGYSIIFQSMISTWCLQC